MRNSQKTPPIMLESTAYNNTDIVNILQIGPKALPLQGLLCFSKSICLIWRLYRTVSQLQIPLQQKRAEIRKRINTIAVPDIPTGQLDPMGNVAVSFAADQCPQGLGLAIGGLDLNRDQL